MVCNCDDAPGARTPGVGDSAREAEGRPVSEGANSPAGLTEETASASVDLVAGLRASGVVGRKKAADGVVEKAESAGVGVAVGVAVRVGVEAAGVRVGGGAERVGSGDRSSVSWRVVLDDIPLQNR